MNIFCPFFKDKCKGNECVMWKDVKCLIISFMEHLIIPLEEEFEEREPIDLEIERIRETEVPDEIKSATPEELAAELIAFTKKEFPDEERIWIRNIAQLFWRTKNVSRWDIPPEIQLKIEKAEMLARRELDNEREIKEKEILEREEAELYERLEKEKAELPSLVSSCVDWARERGFKRITKADVEAFLLNNNIEILPQTQRSLYAMANVELRSKI